ncbi:hypothetical protein [Sphaerospermopsis reniformis]|uniref:hypothetical protein n=1 Tax=Sphaerospermopsis reniformis TaxID=531300 RepID=UPI0013967631|nr:hypothetical protein [Sphaerospermopsis reniformis]
MRIAPDLTKSRCSRHQSPVTSHQSPVPSPQSPVTSPQSPVTNTMDNGNEYRPWYK